MLIYEVLRKDHAKVRMLLTELLLLEDKSDRRKDLIQEIRDEWIPHARAEEAVFYNSLRSLDAAKDIVMHSYQEHIEVEAMLKMLQAKDKVSMDWKKTAQKLKNALEHHIQDEEGRIFNVAQQLLTRDEAEQMARAFERMKPEIREEGFIGTTMDLIGNLMPPRFTKFLRRDDTIHTN